MSLLTTISFESVSFDPNEKNIQSTLLAFISNTVMQSSMKSTVLEIKRLTTGLSNILFSVLSSDNNGFIIKIYDKNSDLIIDRHSEIRYMTYLAKFDISPSIVLRFSNGFIYKYIPGTSIPNGDETKA